MTGRPPAFDHLNGTDHRKRRHEARHPPRLPHHHGDLWLREHLHHPQHGARRHADRRDLLRLPPLLHGQAADPGHRRPRGPLREAVRQAQRQRRPVAHPTAPVPPRVGRAPSSCPAPCTTPERTPMSSADAAPDRLSGLLAEHAALETELADPAVHADTSRARRLGRRYAERRGWATEVLDAVPAELGGYKDVSIAIKSRTDEGIWSRLKFEGGVHRVQRVPVTESQGRIHTSAVGVLVLPEAEEVDVTVDPGDLRIDVSRSSGPGGQSVNTPDSAVRITHLPTGVTVSMQNEKSQLQNREAGMRVLRARLLARALEEQAAKDSAVRGSQIRTMDRSEKVRTYNFPDNRVADHRSGYKANNLGQVLDGDLEPVIQSLVDADNEAALQGETP